MTDWSAILARAFETVHRNRGDSGDTGDSSSKALLRHANLPVTPVTSRNRPVVTVVTRRDEDAVTSVITSSRAGGDKLREAFHSTVQVHPPSVTSVTTVTTDIETLGQRALDKLKLMAPPQSFAAETWRQLLLDAESFYQRLADPTKLLDWSDEDLLGVHPSAPAARFDAMGLLLLARGGEVVELHEQCAKIRSRGGSLLVYRKQGYVGAVPLWKFG
jgi:hypothetical protein